MKTLQDIFDRLQVLSQPERKGGMARYGIEVSKALGVSIPELRNVAKTLGKDHTLAQQLWESDIHEARILASMIDDPKLVTAIQMDVWASGFNSWDVTDQCVNNLFRKTPDAMTKAIEWSQRTEEFVKRSGFVLMAALAVHEKTADDQTFAAFFPLIEQEAHDQREYVKKAVNWALRQIGKRNLALNQHAIDVAKRIQQQSSSSAKWIASDALRELISVKVQARLHKK
jgi:3-methyladenine DNA glycosylase AlkD